MQVPDLGFRVHGDADLHTKLDFRSTHALYPPIELLPNTRFAHPQISPPGNGHAGGWDTHFRIGLAANGHVQFPTALNVREDVMPCTWAWTPIESSTVSCMPGGSEMDAVGLPNVKEGLCGLPRMLFEHRLQKRSLRQKTETM